MFANLKRDTLDAVLGMAYERVNWEDLPTALNARRKNLLFDGLGRLRQNRQKLIDLLTDARLKADDLLGAACGRVPCVAALLAAFILTPVLKIILALVLLVVIIIVIFSTPSDLPPGAGDSPL